MSKKFIGRGWWDNTKLLGYAEKSEWVDATPEEAANWLKGVGIRGLEELKKKEKENK